MGYWVEPPAPRMPVITRIITLFLVGGSLRTSFACWVISPIYGGRKQPTSIGVIIIRIHLPSTVPKHSMFGMCTYQVVGFKDFFIFTPNLGEIIQFDQYISTGLKPPTRCSSLKKIKMIQCKKTWLFSVYRGFSSYPGIWGL